MILGTHMSIAQGFSAAALKTAKEMGCNAMQIFTKSPRSRLVKPIEQESAEEFRKLCLENKITYVIAHSSYLLNFGKPLSEVSWAKEDLLLDFQRLAILGGKGVVIHIGKSLEGDRSQAIQNVIENAKKIIESTEKIKTPTGDQLDYILENTAGQGTEIGFRLDELSVVWKGLEGFSPRIKSCLDTAHIWAAGYDISTESGAKKMLQEYDEYIGLPTLSCFHFNDSKKELGSRVDRHDNIGKGLIGYQGLKTIAKIAVEKNIPLILETPEKEKDAHRKDIATVQGMF